MSTAPLIEALSDEDGEPWGVYAYGHVDPSTITLERLNRALAAAGLQSLKRKPKLEHLWMHDRSDEFGEDFPWFFCSPTDKGAIAITGVKF